MVLTLPITLVVTALLSWWLSGYDSHLSGEHKAADLRRRIIRCVVTLLLVALAVGAGLGEGKAGGFVFIALVVPLAVIWTGCLSECFAQAFHNLIDSPGDWPFDPKKLTADLDRVAGLFAQGRNEEAIKLCTALVKAGEASSLAMEAMLFRLYEEAFAEERLLLSPPLAEANRLSQERQLAEAESWLNLLLKKEPANLAAIMMLIRVYARDSHHPQKAYDLLRAIERRSGIPPFFIAYARRCVGQWLSPPAGEEKSAEGIESLLVDRSRLNPAAKRPSP